MNRENVMRILSDMKSNRCTPEYITSLQPNEVFVYPKSVIRINQQR